MATISPDFQFGHGPVFRRGGLRGHSELAGLVLPGNDLNGDRRISPRLEAVDLFHTRFRPLSRLRYFFSLEPISSPDVFLSRQDHVAEVYVPNDRPHQAHQAQGEDVSTELHRHGERGDLEQPDR